MRTFRPKRGFYHPSESTTSKQESDRIRRRRQAYAILNTCEFGRCDDWPSLLAFLDFIEGKASTLPLMDSSNHTSEMIGEEIYGPEYWLRDVEYLPDEWE